MSTGIYSIGISGLQAAQVALLTTEHNVTNANTPGYTRQRVIQASNVPIMTGAGAIGQGAHVETVSRMYDRFLTGQVNQAQTNVSELDAYYDQISQIDNMLADANAGLSPALQAFFSGVQQVAADPSSLPARQTMVASAQTLVTRYQNMDTRLQALADEECGRMGWQADWVYTRRWQCRMSAPHISRFNCFVPGYVDKMGRRLNPANKKAFQKWKEGQETVAPGKDSQGQAQEGLPQLPSAAPASIPAGRPLTPADIAGKPSIPGAPLPVEQAPVQGAYPSGGFTITPGGWGEHFQE